MTAEERHMKSWKVILVCGWIFAVVLFLTAWHMACAADLQVTWNANTETDLAGYKVYYAQPGDPGWAISDGQITYTLGTLPRSTSLIPGTTYTMPGVPGPYAVAVTALDTSGNESALSAVATALVIDAPQVIEVPPIDVPPNRPVQVIININQ